MNPEKEKENVTSTYLLPGLSPNFWVFSRVLSTRSSQIPLNWAKFPACKMNK